MAAPANPTYPKTADSGIDDIIARELEKLNDKDMDHALAQELAWHWEVKSNKAKGEEFGNRLMACRLSGHMPLSKGGHPWFIWATPSERFSTWTGRQESSKGRW
jgi:hypothetical protein